MERQKNEEYIHKYITTLSPEQIISILTLFKNDLDTVGALSEKPLIGSYLRTSKLSDHSIEGIKKMIEQYIIRNY